MNNHWVDAMIAVGTIAGLYLICLGVSNYQVVMKARQKQSDDVARDR